MARKARPLLQSLILSLSLNALLLSLFLYFMIDGPSVRFAYPSVEQLYREADKIAPALLKRISHFPFEQLVALLSDKRRLGGGYRVCDLALSCLVSLHDFDVERALNSRQLLKIKWECEGVEFFLLRNLSCEDFKKLQVFAAQDLWPFTPKGLFRRIEERGVEGSDPELLNFFCHTEHFILLETLFARTHLPIQKKSILMLAMECGWDRVEAFHMSQQAEADFSAPTRQLFLLDALVAGSRSGAYLLIITDPLFASQQLSDEQVIKLFDLLNIKTPVALEFAKKIEGSCRSDAARQRAHAFLNVNCNNLSFGSAQKVIADSTENCIFGRRESSRD